MSGPLLCCTSDPMTICCCRCPTLETARNNLLARNVNVFSVVLAIWRNTMKPILERSPIHVHSFTNVSHNLETMQHIRGSILERKATRVPIPPNATLPRFMQKTSRTLVYSVASGHPVSSPMSAFIQETSPSHVHSPKHFSS